MRRAAAITFVGILLVAAGLLYWSQPGQAGVTGRISAVAAASGDADPRWKRVTEPRPFAFPPDHGPHEEYQTEWWYYTGNLEDETGRPFGFQLTFFRRGLDPDPPARASRWAARNIYLAHFTLSDIAAGKFYATERYSRDGAEQAGAEGDPYRVWLGPWQARAAGHGGEAMRVQAAAQEFAIDLELDSTKPPTLQGDQGYSRKGEGAGNASYYYSLTRMATRGTVTVGEQRFRIVDGTSWMDHEWGTSRLEEGGVGWDWFALQLSDGRELTWAQLRGANGSAIGNSFGTLTGADGSSVALGPQDLMLEVLDYWTSPASGARYPARWRLRSEEVGLDLRVTPRIPNQELPVSIVYWEGAVAVEGSAAGPGGNVPITGVGYVELTGYLPSSNPIGR